MSRDLKGNPRTLAASFLHFDVSFMLWVLLGALEANVFVPNGEIRLHAEGASRELASGVAIRVPAGAELDFIYPAYGEPME